ncbi:MAG: tetratricopeptide repeat protein [Vicinamibacteria bacterium]
MGRTLIKLVRFEEAERELKRSLELDPNLAEARSFLGALYLDTRDLDSATRELELAVQLSPRYAKAHFYLGQAYLRAGRKEEAKAELAMYERLTRETGETEPH